MLLCCSSGTWLALKAAALIGLPRSGHPAAAGTAVSHSSSSSPHCRAESVAACLHARQPNISQLGHAAASQQHVVRLDCSAGVQCSILGSATYAKWQAEQVQAVCANAGRPNLPLRQQERSLSMCATLWECR